MPEPTRDLLERAVGWYEPPRELLDQVSDRVRRRARRKRVAAATVAAVVFLIGGTLAFWAFGPPQAVTLGQRSDGTYILSDFRVRPALDRQTGEEIPDRALVEYRVTWSTPEYPGEHRCNLAVLDADGREVGSLEFEQDSMMPDPPDGSAIEVNVSDAPASAIGSCRPERLDTPVAYVISDPRVVWADGLAEGEYPGTNACVIDIFAPRGEVFVTSPFTLGTGPGRIEQDVGLGDAKRSALLGQDLSAYSATVRCEPYTAAGGWPPATEPAGSPNGAVVISRCSQATTSGEFDGDGATDDAEFVEVVSGRVSCDRDGEVFEHLSSQELDIRFGSEQTFEQPFTDCQGGLCAYVFAAADLDGDGRDELVIDVSSSGATGLLEFYRVDTDGLRPLVIAEPADPPYVEPGPAILGGGFDSVLQSPVVCKVNDDGTRQLVSIHAENVGDSLSGPWKVHTTIMALHGEQLVVNSTSDSRSSFQEASSIPRFSEDSPFENGCS